MERFALALTPVSLLVATVALASSSDFQTRCESLVGSSLFVPEAARAKVVAAQLDFADPNRPTVSSEHCRVLAETETVHPDDPSDRSVIRSLIRLPRHWNGRLFMGGASGLAGDLLETQLDGVIARRGTPLLQGFATVVNDTGHVGTSRLEGWWALDVPPSPGMDNQKEINYATHSTHLSLVTAKRVVWRLYRRGAQSSYFHGCSVGGRQALVAATSFPHDFDGIIAGAPFQPFDELLARYGTTQRAHLAVYGQLTREKLDRVTRAVLDRCDADDGVADGILTDPRRCDFDPRRDLPACPEGADGADCFTEAQRAFVATVQSDLELHDGNRVSFGLSPGSEGGAPTLPTTLLGWDGWITGTPHLGGASVQLALDAAFRQFFLFDDPDFDPLSYLVQGSEARVQEDAMRLGPPSIGADLDAFAWSGGKLLLYHGWIDPAVPPRSTVRYFEEIEQQTRRRRDRFARLFMIPGMGHCGSGPGAQIFDAVGAMVDWVENDRPPESPVAFRPDGGLSRPLCADPREAVYLGGNPALAENFQCLEK